MTPYVVYWLENEKQQWAGMLTLEACLQYAEKLRARRRAGENICHVVMSIENPDHVGQHGVDVVGPDYDWRKRRP